MNRKINFGECFRLPLESIDGINLRIFYSNLGVTRSYLSEIESTTTLNKHSPSFPYTLNRNSALIQHYIRYLKRNNLPLPNLSAYEYCFKNQQNFRSCTVCSVYGYRSSLYNLPWIKVCPFHRRRLSGRCAECKTPIESRLDNARHCETCNTKLHFLDRVKLRRSYSERTILAWVKLNEMILKITTEHLDFTFIPHDILEHRKSPKLSIFNQYLPSILNATYKNASAVISELGIPFKNTMTYSNSNYKLTNKTSSAIKYNIIRPTNPRVTALNICQKIPNDFYQIRLIALKRITKRVNHYLAPRKRYLVAYDQLKVNYSLEDCPYSLALKFWLNSVTKRNASSQLGARALKYSSINNDIDEGVKHYDAVYFGKNNLTILNSKQRRMIYLCQLITLYSLYCYFAMLKIQQHNDFKIQSLKNNDVYIESKLKKYIDQLSFVFPYASDYTSNVVIPTIRSHRRINIPKYSNIGEIRRQYKKRDLIVKTFGISREQFEDLKYLDSIELERALSESLDTLSTFELQFDRKESIIARMNRFNSPQIVASYFDEMQKHYMLNGVY